MTSIAVTASVCASISEVALLMASFIPFSLDTAPLDSGVIHRCPQRPDDLVCFTRNTPRRVFALTSPHSANIDRDKVDPQCGGILTRLQPTCERVMTLLKRTLLRVCARALDYQAAS